jgi:hypothetical protein
MHQSPVASRQASVAVALAVALVAALAPGRAAERQWQTGTWVDVTTKRQLLDFGPGSSGFGPPNAGLQMRALADVRVFIIETDTLRLELRDTVPINKRSIDVTIGAPVTFALEKNTVYVRDAGGVEYKFRVAKKTTRSPSDRPAAQTYAALGGGHLLREVTRDGRYVTLEDGSTWEIHPRDRFRTVEWEPNDSVSVRTTRAEDGFDHEVVDTQLDDGALARFVPKR